MSVRPSSFLVLCFRHVCPRGGLLSDHDASLDNVRPLFKETTMRPPRIHHISNSPSSLRPSRWFSQTLTQLESARSQWPSHDIQVVPVQA